MVVRVKLRVRAKESKKNIELIVLVNGGAESPRPCLAVDLPIARKLGI